LCQATFEAHCTRVLGDSPSYDWACHAADLYLSCACAVGEREANRILEREMLSPLGRAQFRKHKNRELLQETLQGLRTKLLVGPGAKIGAYAARGPLAAWLGVAAARMLVDLQRAQKNHASYHQNLEPLDASDDDPGAGLLRERFLPSFSQALGSALAGASTLDRRLLRHCLDGTTIDQLGRAYSVHRATAARWLERARNRVFESLRRQLMVRHGLSDEEFDCIAHELCEHLEGTLTSLPEPEAAEAEPRPISRIGWAHAPCAERRSA
jgi:RNA polymerase sigma-70 factor (ECF subfamily)